jgi:hypothetical protein
MEYKIFDILKSTILTEGRKEDAMNKWGADKTLVDTLSDADPSKNNKYLDWMVGMVHSGGYTKTNVIDAVTKFHKNVNKINPDEIKELRVSEKIISSPKNLNSYDTLSELETVVTFLENKKTTSDIKKEADKIYEDDNILVVVPKTVRASCKYGAGTKWCIAGNETGDYNTYFDTYSKDKVFYFVTDKTTTQANNPNHYKYALEYNHNGSKTWWDAIDKPNKNQPEFMNSESGKKALSVIENFHLKAVGDKLKRAIESFLLQPRVSDYDKYRPHISSKDLKVVIKTLIENGGYTYQVFKTILADIDDRTKDIFINKISGLNLNEFNEIKQGLNKEQLYTLVKNNPQVLNNVQTLEEVLNLYTDDEKRELCLSLNTQQITNTDSKTVIMKWRMSKEELDKHKNKTQYVFILDTTTETIKQLLKVDPLDPKSYSKIHLIKMKAAQNPDYTMNSIITEPDLLDEYIESGERDEDIPENVSKNIISKSRVVGKR